MKVHPNSDILIKKKTEWVGIVQKHLKDLVETADTDAITEKSPAPIKDIGVVSQGNLTSFSPMTSSFYTEVKDVISAGHCDDTPDTRSRALGIQPVNLERELEHVVATSSRVNAMGREKEDVNKASLQYKIPRPKT
ncbi:hypothetical protein Hanom_Chr11g01044311 [Helianthus anomalus]